MSVETHNAGLTLHSVATSIIRLRFTILFLLIMLIANFLAGSLAQDLPDGILADWGIGHDSVLSGEVFRLITGIFLSHDADMRRSGHRLRRMDAGKRRHSPSLLRSRCRWNRNIARVCGMVCGLGRPDINERCRHVYRRFRPDRRCYCAKARQVAASVRDFARDHCEVQHRARSSCRWGACVGTDAWICIEQLPAAPGTETI